MVWYGMVWYGMECYHSKYNVLELIMLPSDVCSLDIEDLVEYADTLFSPRVCLCSLHITLWHWSGLHSQAIDPVRCAFSTGRLLRAVYIVHASVMNTPW